MASNQLHKHTNWVEECHPNLRCTSISTRQAGNVEGKKNLINEFKKLDTNRVGRISERQMEDLLFKYCHFLSCEEISEIISSKDLYADGKAESSDAKIRLINEFKELDSDGDGLITDEQMEILVSKYGKYLSFDEFMEILHSQDLHADGKVMFKTSRKCVRPCVIDKSYHFFSTCKCKISKFTDIEKSLKRKSDQNLDDSDDQATRNEQKCSGETRSKKSHTIAEEGIGPAAVDTCQVVPGENTVENSKPFHYMIT
ncbi:hypothetical protein RF11_15879 [Thelohanellus kitauei]|uniref:EF-hand domain-containing protein n=1 Tax=Thelohanellus kitauei TaxID=669202 RepID=A0A0C2JLP8_THEKT|nr:hypothetical protein RF11_15879 [Thelohanellus kitauei]